MGKFGYIEQISSDPGYELPGLVLSIVGIGQFLELVEQVAPHVAFDQSSHDVTSVLHVIVDQNVDYPERYIYKGDPDYGLKCKRCRIACHRIGDESDYQRQHKITCTGESSAYKIENKYRKIRFEIRIKPFQ